LGWPDLGDPGSRIVLQEGWHLLPAPGELRDEPVIEPPHVEQHPEQAVQQREVGSGFELQEEVGFLGGGGTPWISDNEPGPALDPIHHPEEQHRVTVGHVRADHQEQVRVVEVLI